MLHVSTIDLSAIPEILKKLPNGPLNPSQVTDQLSRVLFVNDGQLSMEPSTAVARSHNYQELALKVAVKIPVVGSALALLGDVGKHFPEICISVADTL